MIFTVTNIDNVVKEFTTIEAFVEYAQTIFDENEEDDVFIARYVTRPHDVESAEYYLKTYCENIDLEIA